MAQDRREQITVPLLDPELRARLEQAAERENRTVAGYVRNVVVRALSEQQQTTGAQA